MASLLARLGRFSALKRAWVLSAWLVVLIAVAVGTLSGMRFSDGGFDVPGTDSSRAMEVLDSEFPSESDGGALQLVIQSPEGSFIDGDNVDVLQETALNLEAIRGVESVSDPLNPEQPSVSATGTTAIIDVTFSEGDEEEASNRHEALISVADGLEDQGFIAEVGGTLEDEVPEILGPTEIIGAAIAFLVLMIAFRSLVAAGANMLGALIGVGVGVLGIFTFSAITPIGSVTPILAVMLGLAVGIDYCLFILARFRSELREGRAVHDAIGRAVGTAGSSVAFAGSVVIIALVGLTVVGIPFLGEMGLAAAFAVSVAVLMSLTLLPAMMSWMGRKALPRRDRGTTAPPSDSSPEKTGFFTKWGDWVIKRPVLAGTAAIAMLIVAALPVLGMQTSLSTPGGEDPESSQRAAYELIADEFGAGAQDPLVVLVQGNNVSEAVTNVAEEIESLAGIEMAAPAGVSEDGDTGLVSVIASTGPLDDETQELVRDIRTIDTDGVSVAVTGATAVGIDADEQLQEALVTYILLIVGLSLVLLIILFRSILVPLIATFGFLLSLAAGLGATTAVFQWGWLDALVQAPQGNPLLSLLPLVVTGILFGLAMDYQVFLVSGMHEAHAQGASPKEAIRKGFQRSAVVVVAAAAIMAAVFGGFALSPSSLVGSIALALTVGVLVDAFIVRMIIVPAALSLLGEAAWWMPKWLDRILPRLDVEGTQLEGSGPKIDAETPELAHSVR